jgi:lipoate-protein ligase A
MPPSSGFRVVEDSPLHPQENMDRDASSLLSLMPESPPQLRFYQWEGLCATYGYFINPDQHFHSGGLKKHELKIARRPTGGGILFHHVDLAFSILVPAGHAYYGKTPLESYRTLNGIVLQALEGCGFDESSLTPASGKEGHEAFCMAHPTVFDVVCAGKKIAGAAQRRTKSGLLYQGSLCMTVPDQEFLNDVLLPSQGLLESMHKLSSPLGFSSEQKHAFKHELFRNLQEPPVR